MTGTKFDDSLAVLLGVVKQLGMNIDGLVIVRDHRGRLIVVGEGIEEKAADIRAEISSVLGKYAGEPILITGALASKVMGDPAIKKINCDGDVIRFLDRRIVGADWLTSPMVNVTGPKRLVFGSLKGGVGRSTALAVLAADLAQSGKKVLAIDLDIEAPGIGYMFLPRVDQNGQDRRPKYGVVDYLVENSLGGIADDELYDFIGVSKLGSGSIDVIPAVGRVTDDSPHLMISKLSRALIEDTDKDGQVTSVAGQIAEMVARLSARVEYDAILIDARAGLAEITAAPIVGLGAEVLLFGVAQPQTYHGYSYLLAHLSMLLSGSEASYASWRENVHFVHAKAPAAGIKREPFRDKIYELCSTYLYDAERLNDSGEVVLSGFSPSPPEVGPGVPHDALYILDSQDYGAFDPLSDVTQLDEDVYRGAFGAFLLRAWELLGLERK